jgi:hypothetical protein
LPSALFSSDGARTGLHAAFGVHTNNHGTFRYKIEISQANFESMLFTFDQTFSPEGRDDPKYGAGKLAEFVSPKAMKPGKISVAVLCHY